jgi:hypothetical protein
VTAILVAVSHNTAIPLAFAFGPVKCSDLDEILAGILRDKFHIDLPAFTLELDQDSGLRKFARDNKLTQRFCLRNFLATLKDQVFGVSVHCLVKAQTKEEFKHLQEAYRRQLHGAISRLPAMV